METPPPAPEIKTDVVKIGASDVAQDVLRGNGDIEDVGASTLRYFIQQKRAALIFFVLVAIAFEVALVMLGVGGSVASLSFYLAPIFVFFFWYGIANTNIERLFMQQFAAANGFSYEEGGLLLPADGAMFGIGHSRTVTNTVRGQFDEHPFRLFNYAYVVGEGKNTKGYDLTVFELTYDTDLPGIRMESKFEKIGMPALGIFSGTGLMKLEGNFNDYFTLYVPKEYEIEALEIFTPDIMEILVGEAKQFSIEFVGPHLYIYARGTIKTKKELYDLYGLAHNLCSQLAPTLERMKPGLEAMKTAEQ